MQYTNETEKVHPEEGHDENGNLSQSMSIHDAARSGNLARIQELAGSNISQLALQYVFNFTGISSL